jgi:L-ascorbate metabolism protein UlaG (beta-lactamase superfamily)
MHLHHLRNATTLLSLGEHRLLVDPMLGEVGAMPGFKMFGGGRRRNPLVPLPPGADAALATVTAVVITHEHPDHLDGPGLRWIVERRLPVWTNGVDAPNLAKKGVDVHELCDGSLGMRVETIRSRHGQGALGWLMGPVTGYYLSHPGEPSLYVVGDSVLTESVTSTITRLQPDVILAPAGSANMGLGGDILFSVDELVELVKLARGTVVFNHLEALDHCPTTRDGLRRRMAEEGLSERVLIPADGELLSFEPEASATHAPTRPNARERPGVQKWVTAKFAGT